MPAAAAGAPGAAGEAGEAGNASGPKGVRAPPKVKATDPMELNMEKMRSARESPEWSNEVAGPWRAVCSTLMTMAMPQ